MRFKIPDAGAIAAILVLSVGIVSAGAIAHHQTSVNTEKITEIETAQSADHDILVRIESDVGWIKDALSP